jgi:hypothetical protein
MDPMSDELPKQIEVALKALDVRAGERAARVDADRVAVRVLERLRLEGAAEPRRVLWMTPSALRFAAAVAVLVVAGAAVNLMTEHSARSASVRLPVAGIDSLSAGQLEAVLKAASEVRAANFEQARSSNGSLDDLSEQELQQVLASLDDAEG